MFQAKNDLVKVNKSKTAGEMKFKGDHFGLKGKLMVYGFKDQKILFWVFLQIYDQCFNTYIAKDV